MTAARDLLRGAVITTNPYWPFSHCNRWPYEAACHMFVRAFGDQPDIRSIYLRGSGRRGWVPGLSDIDLTLVLASDLPASREYDLLASIWRTHARLKRLFPMLGEMEILDESEVAAWIRWTSYEPHGPSWTLLHGQRNDDVGSTPSPHWRRRALIAALWVYLVHVPPCLGQPDSSLRGHDLLRRIRKILGLLQPLLSEAGDSQLAIHVPPTDAADLVAGALRALEAAVICVVPIMRRSGTTVERTESTITTRRGQTLHVVADGLASDVLAGRLRSGWRRFEHRGAVVVLPRSLVTYLVRHWDPNEHRDLLESGIVEAGPHPLADIPPPDRQAFAASATDRLFHLPLFVRGPELFSQSLSMASLGNQLNSALAAILFLRQGGNLPYPDKREEGWRRALPEYVPPFEKVHDLLRVRRAHAAHQAAFALVRRVLTDARDLMTRDMPEQAASR